MANILSAGVAGFVGAPLALRLREAGHHVTALDNLSSQIHGVESLQSVMHSAIVGKLHFIGRDVCDSAVPLTAMGGHHVVVHLAAETSVRQSIWQSGRYCSFNVGGTATMLDLLAKTKHRVRRVVVASWRTAYGVGRY
jgi:dTDP-L-rhamnose 4-epimerase